MGTFGIPFLPLANSGGVWLQAERMRYRKIKKIAFFRIMRVRNVKGYGSWFVEGVVKLMLIVERVSG